MPQQQQKTATDLAKAALRRLAEARKEPTPDNYREAFLAEVGQTATEAHGGKLLYELLLQRYWPDLKAPERAALVSAMCEGQWSQVEQRLRSAPAPDGAGWADLIDKIVQGTARGSRQWTVGRRKDSLQRVLGGSRADADRLQQRLRQLVQSWDAEGDIADAPPDTNFSADIEPEISPPETIAPSVPAAPMLSLHLPAANDKEEAVLSSASAPSSSEATGWPLVVHSLSATVQTALPSEDPRAAALSTVFHDLEKRLPTQTTLDPQLTQDFDDACRQASSLLAHRHHLTKQLGVLTRELTLSLSELAEDGSWVQGQSQVMTQHLDEGLTARSVRSVNQLLEDTRLRQQTLQVERVQARDALRQALHSMLHEIGELGAETGRFEGSMSRYANVIGQADSLDSLADVVREMVDETRAVHALVASTQQRLNEEHSRATQLSDQVQTLEDELRRISAEVATDPLTQIANRRGLMQAFDIAQAQAQRDLSLLAVGLLDIDNFKKLNDQFGHNTGDAALRFLAERVKASLRPNDTVARWGGEEFVVLLPATDPDDAQQILTRLQRNLSAELFMHEGQKTLVTFSAGVTRWRLGERIEESLERADEALYHAKQTGKNRTCVG
jgi:diguanylate cyclase